MNKEMWNFNPFKLYEKPINNQTYKWPTLSWYFKTYKNENKYFKIIFVSDLQIKYLENKLD